MVMRRNWGQSRITIGSRSHDGGRSGNSGLTPIFRRPAGFTLLEIVVTLVLIGLGAALVAPVFRQDQLPDDSLTAVLAGARELAVRRAEDLVLAIDAQGAWRLTAGGDTSTIAAGVAANAGTARRLTVTPLGACFDEGSAPAANWDALACAPTGGARP